MIHIMRDDMTCTPREDSDQTAFSQSLLSRLYEYLLDTLWVDKDQKYKWTAKTLIRNARMRQLIWAITVVKITLDFR